MSAEWKVGLSTGGSLVAWDGDEWRWAETGLACVDQPPLGLRPLVLIDPEDREQVERLIGLYYVEPYPSLIDDMQAALREYASPTPPKPDEPSNVGAVVNCTYGDHSGYAVKWNEAEWIFYGSGLIDHHAMFDDLENVEVLSAGVES